MGGPRWRKVLADVRMSSARTALVVLSIAIGIFAVGTMLTTGAVLQRSVDDSFDRANASSAVVYSAPFAGEIVDQVRALPEIADAEARSAVTVRFQGKDGSWQSLELAAIGDFDNIRVDRIFPQDGSWPPSTGDVLIERASLADSGVAIGDELSFETPDGAEHTLRVVGTAYDPGKVAPSLASDLLAGYITLDTLAALGQPASFDELHLIAANEPRELQQGEAVAGIVRDQVLEPAGIAVHRIAVQDTSRYHAQALTDSIVLVLTMLGGLILLLGVFLVLNTVNALLTQQVRQIGVMKAVGGRQRQIAGMYLGLVLVYSVIALIVAIPLAVAGAWTLSSILASMLNLELDGPWLPPYVVAIELLLGLAVPILTALLPVMRGTRITVREAITSHGIGTTVQAGGLTASIVRGLQQFPRTIVLAIGNIFRRPGRLALTLITLTIGGALFASVASIQASLDETMTGIMKYTDYDVELSLQEMSPAPLAISAAEAVAGVEQAEGWIVTNPSRVRPDGTQNSNIWLIAPPSGTQLVKPSIVEGRWLQPGEHDALVANVDFMDGEPDLALGDRVTLKVEGTTVTWPIVGVVSSQLTGPVIYAPLEALSGVIGAADQINRVVLVSTEKTAAARTSLATEAEQALRAAGMPVGQVQTSDDVRGGTQSAFDVLVMLFTVVGLLLALVGGIGLAGAMSLSVIERRREIGVMRAIGASNRAIARIVITEGLTIGLLSWILGALLALPVSWLLGWVIGETLLQAPLSYRFSLTGVALWLGLVAVLTIVASVLPARGAWKVSVREALAYE